jgi:hypothetical protein
VAYGLPDGPRWTADEHEVVRWCRLLQESGIPADPQDLLLAVPEAEPPVTGAVVVHPGAAQVSRRWPVQRWGRVAAALAADGHDVRVTGGPGRAVARGGGRPQRRARPAGRARRPHGPARAVGARRRGAARRQPRHGRRPPRHGLRHAVGRAVRPDLALLWGPPVDRPQHRALWAGRTGDNFAAEPDAGLLELTVEAVLTAASDLLARPSPLEHGRPVGDEALDAEALPGRAPCTGRQLRRLVRLAQQALQVTDEPLGVGVDVAVHAVLHGRRHLRGRQADDRQAERHRLADGQPERGVPDRVEEHPVLRQPPVQVGERDVAEPRGVAVAVHAGEVDRHVADDALEDVGAQAAAAVPEVVHDRDRAGGLPGPGRRVRRHLHAVVDDGAGRRPAVPHERVERRDVDEQRVRVLHRVQGVVRPGRRRVVLDVHARQVAHAVAEELVAVGVPVAPVLGQHQVDVEVAHLLRGHLLDVVAPGERRTASAVPVRPVGAHRQQPGDRHLRQVVEVGAVDVPGQDAQG